MTIIFVFYAICMYFFIKKNNDSPTWLKFYALSPLVPTPLLQFISIFFLDAPTDSWKPFAAFCWSIAFLCLSLLVHLWRANVIGKDISGVHLCLQHCLFCLNFQPLLFSLWYKTPV